MFWLVLLKLISEDRMLLGGGRGRMERPGVLPSHGETEEQIEQIVDRNNRLKIELRIQEF